jgi:hypothetical protein
MSISHLDQLTHPFQCENAECGKPFEKVLRSLLNAKEVTCPHCGAPEDIRTRKSTGDIGRAFDLANQLDIQADQKK